ncbi:MAG: hypothetical protein ACFFE8_08845 [Candidatus Heimdallarchaeota archaeon]
MKNQKTETSWGSTYSGQISKGCQQCHRGEKMVVLVSSVCNSKCFYCPLSQERLASPHSFANERPIMDINDLTAETILMDAAGASMTGGDPFESHSFSKTLDYCRTLKNNRSQGFHIHLYTRGKEITRTKLAQIVPYLDEMRFHVKNIDKDLPSIAKALEFPLDVGIEVPVLPTKTLEYYQELILRFEALIPENDQFYFVNLNELEFSETNYRRLIAQGLKSTQYNLAAVEGSMELGQQIVTWASENCRIPVHFCALATKDSIQLPNRLLRIARNVQLPGDVIIEEGPDKGLLLRGIIQTQENNLPYIRRMLIDSFQIPDEWINLDYKNNRLLTNAALIEELKNEIKSLFPSVSLGIIEEYPTHDKLQTMFIPL